MRESLLRLSATDSMTGLYARNPREAIEKSGESSRTTHEAPAAVDACRYLGALLVGAVNGASKEELLSDRYTPVPGYTKGLWFSKLTRLPRALSNAASRRRYRVRVTWSSHWKRRSGLFITVIPSGRAVCWRLTWATTPTPPALFTASWRVPITASRAYRKTGGVYLRTVA
jgi:ADP-ribosylglycohydrolase